MTWYIDSKNLCRILKIGSKKSYILTWNFCNNFWKLQNLQIIFDITWLPRGENIHADLLSTLPPNVTTTPELYKNISRDDQSHSFIVWYIYADSTKLWEVCDCAWFYFHLMPICFGFYFALRRTTQFTSLFGFYIHRWICLFINNSKTSACPVKMLQRYTCISVGKYRHFWSFFVQTLCLNSRRV